MIRSSLADLSNRLLTERAEPEAPTAAARPMIE
jgi:hypothetical protein